MGTVSSGGNNNEDFGHLSNLPQNLRKLELNFDVNKLTNPNLRQLLFWSLKEIRGVYEKFQRRSHIPFIDKNMFCKIVPFTRTNAFFIFDHFSKNNKLLSIYEFLCVLTLTAYTTHIHKIHFLYILFDLDCSGNISLNELLIIFKSIVMGFCKLTDAELPSYNNLEKFAKLMFLKSDIQADNSLELKEIIEWAESNQKAMDLFNRFEPQKYKTQEQFETFKTFHPYSEEDANNILKMITRANKSEYYCKSLNDMMGKKNKFSYMGSTQSYQASTVLGLVQSQSLPKLQVPQKANKDATQPKQEGEDEMEELEMIERALDSHAKKYETHEKDLARERQILPSLQQKKEQKFLKRKRQISRAMKNIIIIKGCTLTRGEIFKLKDYFDRLADQNNSINVKDFTKSFADKPHMKRVTASLYNFLDEKQQGFVRFDELLMKMYPSLENHHLQLINFWINQYNSTFQIETKEQAIQLEEQKEDKNQQKRKRILPRSTLKRIKEIFDLLDEDQKGYLSFEDLKRNYTYGFTKKELEDLFKQHDQDKDGKLQVEDFIRILLPPDYVIEEQEEVTTQ